MRAVRYERYGGPDRLRPGSSSATRSGAISPRPDAGFAEFVATDAGALRRRPAGVDPIEAAAIPQAGGLAKLVIAP